MNAADNFVMKYDPVEIERRERAEIEAKRRKKERKEAEEAQQLSSQNTIGSDDRSRPRSKSPDEDRERMNCDDEDASNNSSSHKTPEDNDDDDDNNDDVMKVCRQDSDSPRSTVYSEIWSSRNKIVTLPLIDQPPLVERVKNSYSSLL